MNSKQEYANAGKRISTFMKKRKLQLGLTTIICSALTFNVAFAQNPIEETSIKEIFHIYNGQEYIGAVADEQKVDTLVAIKQEEANNEFKELNVDAGSNITVVPEQVFTIAVDEEEALKTLEQKIEIEAEALAVKVGDQTVAYVKNQADFEETIKQLKLLFVSEEQLETLNTSNQVQPLEKNETRIKAVNIDESVKVEATKVSPTYITEPKQLAKRLVEGGKVMKNYTVQQGDTLNSIAKAYGISVNEIVKNNPHLTADSNPVIGEKLKIEIVEPYVNVEVQYEALKLRSVDYQTEVKKSSSLLKGKTEVKQEGQKGKRELLFAITEVNGERKSKVTVSDEVVAEPITEIKVVGTKETPHLGTGSFAWPAVGGYVSSKMGPRWGRNHDGIDIARPSDYTIKASDNGKVIKSASHSTYGNYVVIDHNNGYETLYAHLSSSSVSVGQTVAKGQKIGVMGSTGRSTGVHLHFEVYKNGTLVNPLNVLNQ